MHSFLTNAPTPLRPKKKPAKRENVAPANGEVAEKRTALEILHDAINEEKSEQVFDILNKNRPFEKVLKKNMSKVYFGSSFASDDSNFMLLQVDEKLAKALENGEDSVSIRGDMTDDTVVCTMSGTYPIKMIESSTSYMLLDTPVGPTSACAGTSEQEGFADHMIRGKSMVMAELCPPLDVLDIGRLKDILHKHSLSWGDSAEVMETKGVKLSELLNHVQLSRAEIELALDDLPVIRVNNKIYYLSHAYRAELLGIVVDLLDDDTVTDVNMDKINPDALRFAGVPDCAVDWVVANLCMTSEDYLKIDRYRFVRTLIVTIINSLQRIPAARFKEMLRTVLPDGMEYQKSDLEGICDIIDSPTGKYVVYLSPEDLPDNVQDRMRYLFEQRKQWSMDALRPFFHDLIKNKVSFDKFVVQNCEYTVAEDGKMYYCGLKMGA